jgi:hypothetical protein
MRSRNAIGISTTLRFGRPRTITSKAILNPIAGAASSRRREREMAEGVLSNRGFESPSASLVILALACDRPASTRGPVAFVQHVKFLPQFDHAALGQDAAKVHARINHAIASQQ